MIKILLKETFYFFTIALLLLCSLELAWPGLVLAYVNLNIVLIFWLIIGILLLIKKEV